MAATHHAIFNHLDSPVKILFWTKGELVLILGPFFLGILCDAFFLGVIGGALNFWGIKAYQKRFGKGQLAAVMYWYLPRSKKLQCLPESYIHEYLS
jgi:type IV conjugative transfer system protein TraL